MVDPRIEDMRRTDPDFINPSARCEREPSHNLAKVRINNPPPYLKNPFLCEALCNGVGDMMAHYQAIDRVNEYVAAAQRKHGAPADGGQSGDWRPLA